MLKLFSIRSKRFYSIEPLKIAFFGSDQFSIKCLSKLHDYKLNHPSGIDSIHVVTRSIKPTGRNLKTLVDLPVGQYSTDLGIPIIRADTSSEILNIKHNFNLIIAVSYGKLIPGSLISRCKYGGLNVHPSLLPKYSGSSPIQYTLMNDDEYTGCTVQTLHPTKFDHGDIILQSEKIPVLNNDNYESLVSKLSQIGGELLVESIDLNLFIKSHRKHIPAIEQFSLASKINKSQHEILWDLHSSRKIKRLYDALGPLFTYIKVKVKKKKKIVEEIHRIILSDISEIQNPNLTQPINQIGEFTLSSEGLIVRTTDGYVKVGKLKLQAQIEDTPESFIRSYSKKIGVEMPKKFILNTQL